MALKIKKKKSDKLAEEQNTSTQEDKYLKIVAIENEHRTQKGFKAYKKNIPLLRSKGYSDKEIKSLFTAMYTSTLLPVEEIKNKLSNTEEQIEQSVQTINQLNDILFEYLFETSPNEYKIEKEKISQAIKLFHNLLEENKEALQIKLYSAYRKEDGSILTLYDRMIEEIKIYHKTLKYNQETSLSNLFALFKTISFVAKDILTEKNSFLLGSMAKLTSKNKKFPMFINGYASMNYGHGLETISAMHRIKDNSLQYTDIEQLDIAEWNNFYKYQISEAHKLGLVKQEDILRSIASADLIETTSKTKKVIEVKHYSENDYGNLNIYLKRPWKMLTNFKNISNFAKTLGDLTSVETGKNVKGEAIYDITIYKEEKVSQQLEITMEDYAQLFLDIGKYIAKNVKIESIGKSKTQIMINDTLLEISLNYDFKVKEEEKATQEDFSNKNIFDENNYVKGISNITLNFENSDDFIEIIKQYNGKAKLNFNSAIKKEEKKQITHKMV